MSNVSENVVNVTLLDKNEYPFAVGDAVCETTGSNFGGVVEHIGKSNIVFRDMEGDLQCCAAADLVIVAKATSLNKAVASVALYDANATTTDKNDNVIRVGSVVSDQNQICVGTVVSLVPGYCLILITDEGGDLGEAGSFTMQNADDLIVVGIDPSIVVTKGARPTPGATPILTAK